MHEQLKDFRAVAVFGFTLLIIAVLCSTVVFQNRLSWKVRILFLLGALFSGGIGSAYAYKEFLAVQPQLQPYIDAKSEKYFKD